MGLRAAPEEGGGLVGRASQKPPAAGEEGRGALPRSSHKEPRLPEARRSAPGRTVPYLQGGAQRSNAPWGRGGLGEGGAETPPGLRPRARHNELGHAPTLPAPPSPPAPAGTHPGADAAAAQGPAWPPPRLGRRRRFLPPGRARGPEVSGFTPPSPASLLPPPRHQHADPARAQAK